MIGRGRLLALAMIGLLLAAIGLDWLQAQARLHNISIEGQLDPPKVVADGKNSITLTVRVTENGMPRANSLLQAWLESGGGIFIPEWTYTDADGRAEYTYTPNAVGPYDMQEPTIIHVIDLNVARLFEVDKHYLIEVPVEAPLSTSTD